MPILGIASTRRTNLQTRGSLTVGRDPLMVGEQIGLMLQHYFD
jgi:hypothetical protein